MPQTTSKPWDYQCVWKEKSGPVGSGRYQYCAMLKDSILVQYITKEEAMLIREYLALRRMVAAIEAERANDRHT